jgi:hypothetical protein
VTKGSVARGVMVCGAVTGQQQTGDQRRGESSGLVLSFGAAQDGGRANKRERKAEEGGLRIMKGSRNLVEAPDG